MPKELERLLTRSIQGDAVSTDEMMAAFEAYSAYIDSLNPPKGACSQSFITQIAEFVRSSNGQLKDMPPPAYVGVFFDKEQQKALERIGCEVQKSHVTIWHSKHGEPFGTTGTLVGNHVSVTCDAILGSLDEKLVALRVASMFLTDGTPVPCQNVFAHITLVCPKGGAYLSNKLPDMVENGTATQKILPMILVLKGEIKAAN
jgi:hypothetical protein